MPETNSTNRILNILNIFRQFLQKDFLHQPNVKVNLAEVTEVDWSNDCFFSAELMLTVLWCNWSLTIFSIPDNQARSLKHIFTADGFTSKQSTWSASRG